MPICAGPIHEKDCVLKVSSAHEDARRPSASFRSQRDYSDDSVQAFDEEALILLNELLAERQICPSEVQAASHAGSAKSGVMKAVQGVRNVQSMGSVVLGMVRIGKAGSSSRIKQSSPRNERSSIMRRRR